MTEPPADNHRAIRDLARTRGRVLIAEGVEWRVYELPPGVYDRRGAATLVFESADVFRRVRDYPAAWRTLSDGDLYAVSMGT